MRQHFLQQIPKRSLCPNCAFALYIVPLGTKRTIYAHILRQNSPIFRQISIDKSTQILYNSGVKKNIDRAAILTDIADHRRGMQRVLGTSLADRLGISVLYS